MFSSAQTVRATAPIVLLSLARSTTRTLTMKTDPLAPDLLDTIGACGHAAN
jgi:hypothetical protein